MVFLRELRQVFAQLRLLRVGKTHRRFRPNHDARRGVVSALQPLATQCKVALQQFVFLRVCRADFHRHIGLHGDDESGNLSI